MIKRHNLLVLALITALLLFLSSSGFLIYRNRKPQSADGNACGGWDTSGQVVCECSGQITKPTCPPGVLCDSGSYYCKGQCGNCCYNGIAENHPLPKCTDDKDARSNLQSQCERVGGTWLDKFKECEGLGATDFTNQWCVNLGGNFSGCDSACRHAPQPTLCIQVCVPVCKFN